MRLSAFRAQRPKHFSPPLTTLFTPLSSSPKTWSAPSRTSEACRPVIGGPGSFRFGGAMG